MKLSEIVMAARKYMTPPASGPGICVIWDEGAVSMGECYFAAPGPCIYPGDHMDGWCWEIGGCFVRPQTPGAEAVLAGSDYPKAYIMGWNGKGLFRCGVVPADKNPEGVELPVVPESTMGFGCSAPWFGPCGDGHAHDDRGVIAYADGYGPCRWLLWWPDPAGIVDLGYGLNPTRRFKFWYDALPHKTKPLPRDRLCHVCGEEASGCLCAICGREKCGIHTKLLGNEYDEDSEPICSACWERRGKFLKRIEAVDGKAEEEKARIRAEWAEGKNT